MISWHTPHISEAPRFSVQAGESPFGLFRIAFKSHDGDWGVEVIVTPWEGRKRIEGGTLKQAREWCEAMMLEKIRECLPQEPAGTVQSMIHVDWSKESTHGVAFVDKDIPPGTPLFAAPLVETEGDTSIQDIYFDALQEIIHCVWGTPDGTTGEQAAHNMHGIAEKALEAGHQRARDLEAWDRFASRIRDAAPFQRAANAEMERMVQEIKNAGPGRIEVKPDDRLMAVVDHACGHLPEGISVTLTMENGAGTFEAHDKDGNRIDLPEFTDSALPEELAGIVNYLMNWDQTDNQQRQEEPPISNMLEDAVKELSEYKHAQVEEIALNMLAACYRENMREARQRLAEGQEVEFLEFIEHATDDAFMLAQKFVEQSETIMREGESKAWALVEKAQNLSNGE